MALNYLSCKIIRSSGYKTLTGVCFMRQYSKVLLALALSAWIVGCNQGEKADEKAIKDTIKSYQEAYNQRDAEKLTALWATDATYINPVTGETAEGREAIGKLFKERFAKDRKVHLEITTKNIEFLSDNEAIERGVMKISLPEKEMQSLAYRVGLIKENGKWLVNSIGEIELQEVTSNFEHLKDLEWMVGNWEDIDDNIEIFFTNRWDGHKNFLTENFQMKIYGHDDIEGKQIIGWDPVKKVIRSWVFDSDGGFGEGTWEKSDKSWQVDLHFTLSDGRTASSKNIYTPIDANSYTFASVQREVDGELLPDMEPVTVEKKGEVAP